jgi:hypothetical protein
MAARFLGMFSKLGTTATGSRALGESLMDFFALAQEAIAKQYADVTNEHVIEDLVDINFSIDENAPLLKFDTETDKRYSVADLKLLIDAGALTPYPELEEYLRSEGDLPKPKDPEDQPEDQADDEGDDEPTPLRPAARTRIKAAMTVGGRTLRRNPLPHELKAAVDWDAMEEAWSSQQTSLVDQWKTEVKTAHVDTLVEAIEAAETLDQLAALEAPVLGEQLMSDAMFALAEIAGAEAVAEAAALLPGGCHVPSTPWPSFSPPRSCTPPGSMSGCGRVWRSCDRAGGPSLGSLPPLHGRWWTPAACHRHGSWAGDDHHCSVGRLPRTGQAHLVASRRSPPTGRSRSAAR